MSQPSSRGRITLWPRLEIGNSSAAPWSRPSTTAWTYEIGCKAPARCPSRSERRLNGGGARSRSGAHSCWNGTGSGQRRDVSRAVPMGSGKTTGMLRETDVAAPWHEGRTETALERCDRNLVELLQEVRVVQTGVQVLFAFLLTVPLAAGFPALTAFQRGEYFATLLVTGAAAVLLIAPTAYHRILFRLGDKEHLIVVANRFTMAGLFCVAVSIVGALMLVTDLLFGTPVVI